MRIQIKRLPEHMYSWHRWFAWYPVRAFDSEVGWGTWVWLEKVERMYEYGWPEAPPYYRVVELWRKEGKL